jgi:hypothetical protein
VYGRVGLRSPTTGDGTKLGRPERRDRQFRQRPGKTVVEQRAPGPSCAQSSVQPLPNGLIPYSFHVGRLNPIDGQSALAALPCSPLGRESWKDAGHVVLRVRTWPVLPCVGKQPEGGGRVA